ncbi:hypothetical protein BH09VER1_BH09VER1_24910 [soil metagenome]
MTTPDLATKIELRLLQAGGFVSTRQICAEFSITKRRLRQDDDRPGMLDEFAVSCTTEGEAGYIHHRHLPDDIWLQVKGTRVGHALAELRRVRKWTISRHNILTGKRPDLREVHTGQALLFYV